MVVGNCDCSRSGSAFSPPRADVTGSPQQARALAGSSRPRWRCTGRSCHPTRAFRQSSGLVAGRSSYDDPYRSADARWAVSEPSSPPARAAMGGRRVITDCRWRPTHFARHRRALVRSPGIMPWSTEPADPAGHGSARACDGRPVVHDDHVFDDLRDAPSLSPARPPSPLSCEVPSSRPAQALTLWPALAGLMHRQACSARCHDAGRARRRARGCRRGSSSWTSRPWLPAHRREQHGRVDPCPAGGAGRAARQGRMTTLACDLHHPRARVGSYATAVAVRVAIEHRRP